ncbi:MAG: hypothetical protein ABI954_11885 [Pyrinomonadaceae bacterium]
MNNIFQVSNLLKASSLLSIIVVSFVIARSSLVISHPQVVIGITLDLTLTLPLAYLFFIRGTKISKLTAVPLFVFGIIFASFVLPADNQHFLNLLKLFALPVLELGVLAYVGFVVHKSRKTFQSLGQKRLDVLENLRETLVKEFPIKSAANALTYEIAGFYYALIGWKARRGANYFTYHEKNGVAAVLLVFGFLAAIETLILHILLAKWNGTLAWILTFLSIYFLFQLVAHGKAVFLRPIEIAEGKIFIRCGLLGDATVEIENIESVEITTQTFESEKGSVTLSPLGKLAPPNLKMCLRHEAVLNGIYGIKKKFKTILLTVDEAEKFQQTILKSDL